jgi:hypothetical protein
MALSPDFKKVILKLNHVDELIEACLQMDIASYSSDGDDWVTALENMREVLKLMGIKFEGDSNDS